jgi:hypothetical protein
VRYRRDIMRVVTPYPSPNNFGEGRRAAEAIEVDPVATR